MRRSNTDYQWLLHREDPVFGFPPTTTLIMDKLILLHGKLLKFLNLETFKAKIISAYFTPSHSYLLAGTNLFRLF